ncbi:hypothetical protein FB382_000517 [Nocardioides ginsengisegetis]|uniref:Uncharacterized protein n=1 Tax=Nocardioides ginsengisegetis TaxID=661491 RepID=A0A7W3P8C1_9ACTN|nr:hypothetical protein [Nocardioides ginsengisegetis]MBA8802226.1 hypothetical protein [Nocardioides ginsengisegetis]
MSEDTLRRLLDEGASGVEVGPVPLAAIGRRARRRRTSFVAGAAAAVVLSAGVGVGVAQVVAGHHGAGPAAPTKDYRRDEVPVFLPTGPEVLGGAHDLKLTVLTGRLVATHDDRCLVLESGDAVVPVFWPDGYEGLVHDGSGFSLLDGRGEVVAEVGDRVELGGTFLDPASWSGDDLCIPADQKSFLVRQAPTVVD